jgi:hypothetical protein
MSVGTSCHVDWARWMEVSDEEREAMRRRYREQIRRESENNAARWARMTPEQRQRYPEP